MSDKPKHNRSLATGRSGHLLLSSSYSSASGAKSKALPLGQNSSLDSPVPRQVDGHLLSSVASSISSCGLPNLGQNRTP
jgi:hypothetical protein